VFSSRPRPSGTLALSPHSRSRLTIHKSLRVRVRVATRFSPEGESLLPRRPTNTWPKPRARSLVLHRCVAAAIRHPPKRPSGVQKSRCDDMSLHPCHRCGPDQESPPPTRTALSGTSRSTAAKCTPDLRRLPPAWLCCIGVVQMPLYRSEVGYLLFDPVIPPAAKVLTRPKPARLPWCQSSQLQGVAPPTSP
jgi:hypothetical protein